MDSKTTVTKEQIATILASSKTEVSKMGEKTTVVCVTLPNGFVILQSSSCVDPANYDHDLGTKICMKRVEDKIWELEGYLLQSKITEIGK